MADSYKGYTFSVEDNVGPVAVITPSNQTTVVGALVKLDGRASFDRDGNPGGDLLYTWKFSQIPIGSQVEIEGFQSVDPDDSVVTFAPDITGLYEVELTVSDGSLVSEPAVATTDVRVIIVPNNQGLIPDASFIWNYLSDFWNLVDGRERFEVLWSSTIQAVAAEILKLWQIDYNKSIRDIQEVFQRRWQRYSPALTLDTSNLTGILAQETAGVEASTLIIDPSTCIPQESQPDFFNMVTIPDEEGSFVTSPFGSPILPGRVLSVAGQCFTMSRSNDKKLAVNRGEDGKTTSGTDTFNGSSFDSDQEGLELKILSGADKGTYIIKSVVSDTQITVENVDGTAVSFEATATDIPYSVCPTKTNISAFFADRKVVPTLAADQPWRFFPTLVSSETDFESEGVSEGDLLEVEVFREDKNLSGLLRVQIGCVDRKRIGFTFNRKDLEPGTASGGLTEEDQEFLAEALQVSGLERDVNGVLQYSLEAELIKKTLESVSFKRSFLEKKLTPDTSIDVGAFTIRLRPKRIIRNSKISIHEDTISIPVLQEYIRQPEIAEEDGQLYIVSRAGKLHPINQKPAILVENLDFVLDDESTIRGSINLTQNSEIAEIPRGDLLDRSVQPGDTLEVQIGATFQVFNIRKVLSSTEIRVFPTPSSTETGVPFVLTRRIPGKFIRFVKGTFTKDAPAPKNLWAELTFMSNDENIEKNFGVLVGVRREDLERELVQAPYRSVVAGLMFALTKGPVIENIRLSSQILLGLPFAENAGVITEINPEFRLREDGSPRFGRILIEGRDDDDQPTGITNIYLFPQGRQLVDPDDPDSFIPATPNEAGIAINPDTGEEYKVGDKVNQFAVLSKGVEVRDYLGSSDLVKDLVDEGNISALVTQYHSLSLRINADVTTPSDVNQTTSFIRRAKPHYIKLSAGLLKVIEDFVSIEDSIIFGRKFEFFDTESYSLPTAVKFDAGAGEDDFISMDGVMYARYVFGTDLETTQGSNQVTSPSGGFVNAGTLESHDSPFLRSGDLLIINEGPNAGRYDVSTVDSDTALTVSFTGTFETKTGQLFRVYRPVINPLFQGSVDVSIDSDLISIVSGTFSAGVAVGDVVTFHGGSVNASRKYTIIDTDHDDQKIRVTPPVVEASGTYQASIWREGILTKYLINEEDDTPHVVDLTSGDPEVQFQSGSSDLDQLSFIRVGDVIIVEATQDTFTVIDFDPISLKAWVTPPPASTSAGEACKISRPTRSETSISFEILDRIPDESLVLELQLPSGQQDLVTTASSSTVTTASGEDFDALGIKPGDFLVIFEGGDSKRDVGYGEGVFPILDLPSTTQLELTRELTVNSTGFRYGLRRKKVL